MKVFVNSVSTFHLSSNLRPVIYRSEGSGFTKKGLCFRIVIESDGDASWIYITVLTISRVSERGTRHKGYWTHTNKIVRLFYLCLYTQWTLWTQPTSKEVLRRWTETMSSSNVAQSRR